MNQIRRLLIVGCGYLGQRIVPLALRQGQHVIATTRSRPQRIAAMGATPRILDWDDPRTLRDLPSVDAVVIAVAYDRRSSIDRETSQVDGLRRFIDALDKSHSHQVPIAYVSTTGVYHQTGGHWVDESSTTRPTRDGGRAHLRAEAVLRGRRPRGTSVILRLAGIYGPGRVPRAADVMAGRPIASPPDGFLNLIHVDDAAEVVHRALTPLASNQSHFDLRPLYVVADDHPVIRGEFYREIARQTRSPEPRFIDPGADAGVRFRSETNKRVWNRAMKRDLLPQLNFPSYVEGLRQILRNVSPT